MHTDGKSKPANANKTSMELAADREIVIARTFNGPAHIVYQAWTDPDLVRRWWAPTALGVSMMSCDADIRVGGSYRYVLSSSHGDEVAFSGEYMELTPHSRLVYSQVFEPMAHAGAAIITVTFTETDGKTRMVSRELYPSAEVRDGVLASGMEDGMRATMDQLDELVASLPR